MARTENWIKWDLASREDPKTRFFLSKYPDKARAYGFFVWLVEKLYATNDGWIDLDDIFAEGFAHEINWNKTEVLEAIAKLIEAKLFLLEANRFASKRALAAIKEREKLSSKRAIAGRKGGIKSASSKQLLSKSKQIQAKSVDEIRVDESRLDKSRSNNIYTPPGKTLFGKFVYLSEAELEAYTMTHGKELLDRAIEKLDAWIESDPTPKRLKNGQNASACFRSWVFNAIAEEQGRKSNLGQIQKKQTPAQKTFETASKMYLREKAKEEQDEKNRVNQNPHNS